MGEGADGGEDTKRLRYGLCHPIVRKARAKDRLTRFLNRNPLGPFHIF